MEKNFSPVRLVYWLTTGLRSGVSTPRKRSALLHNHPDQCWGLPNLLFNGYHGSFLGVKWQKHEDNRSAPSSAQLKNDWSYTSTPLVCLHGIDWDKLNVQILHQFSMTALNIQYSTFLCASNYYHLFGKWHHILNMQWNHTTCSIMVVFSIFFHMIN